MHQVLEAVHCHLAKDGRDRTVDPLRQKTKSSLIVCCLVEQPPEHQRLAEHRRGFRERQRRRELEHPLGLGEGSMKAMAELVGHRQDVALAGGEVQQHVGVNARHRVRAERASALVRPNGSIDPPLIEEPPRYAPGLWSK